MMATCTSHTNYNKDTRTFTIEASDLQLPPGRVPDTITLRSQRTGITRDFKFHKQENDREGDTLAWLYHNAKDDLWLRIFND